MMRFMKLLHTAVAVEEENGDGKVSSLIRAWINVDS
jgi:hypothetical protein